MARDRDDDRNDDRRERSPRRDDENEGRPQRSYQRGDNRPGGKQLNVLGLLSMILGIVSVIVTIFFGCCYGWVFGIVGGVSSLIMGVIGMSAAKKSDGRMGGGMAIAGTVLGIITVVFAILWGLFFAALFGLASSRPTPSTAGGSVPVVASDPVAASVAALELSKEHSDDKAAADAKYQGKVVEVTGKVKGVIDTGGESDIKVELVGFNLADVACHFDSSRRSSVTNLTDRSTVTIRGRYVGGNFDVNLNDCIVMPAGAPKPPGDGAGKGPNDAALKVSATRLVRAYTDNVVSASATYDNKMLEVTGPVFATDLTDADNQVVFLGLKGKDIECRFGKESLRGQAAITTGKQVTVRGKCKGNDDGPVVLEDCKLVK